MKRSVSVPWIVSSFWIVLAPWLVASPTFAQSEEAPPAEMAPAGAPPGPTLSEGETAGDETGVAAEPVEAEQEEREDARTDAAVAVAPDMPAPEPIVPAPPAPHDDLAPPSVAFRPGDGLTVRSADGNFELTTRVRAMLLFDTEIRDGEDVAFDLEVRRARVIFQGCVFDRSLRYRLQLAIAPRDMQWVGGLDGHATRTPLLDWYVESRHLRELNVRVGQFVTNFSRERTVASSSFQLVDRSLMSGEFNLDRDLAIELRSLDVGGLGWLRYYAGIGNGEGRDSLLPPDTALQYYARIEILPLGFFDDYVQGDLDRSPEPRVSIGAGYAFLDRAHNDHGILGHPPADGGTTDMHLVNADLYFVYRGLSLMYEFTWRDGYRHDGDAIDPATGLEIPMAAPRNGYGMFAQAGYLLPDVPIEFAARWGIVAPAGTSTALTERQELGAGVNWYIHEHALKLQADFFELWQGSAIDQGEERVRVMFQAAL